MNGEKNRAECAFVDRWLDDWLAGRLHEEAARRVEQHVGRCAPCRQLTAIVADAGSAANDAATDDGFLSEVLDRTTGSPCARAETLLPALVDDELDTDSGEMLRAHLAHCDACSRLFAVLQEARQVLPALSEIQPPFGFVQRVLAATTAAPAPSLWWRLLSRPRASLELAYVATVLLVVLLGNPVGAFSRAEQRASQLAGRVPVAQLSEQLGVAKAAQGTIGRFFAGVTSVVTAVRSEIARRLNQARTLLQAIETSVANAITWIATVDVKQMLGGNPPPPPRGQPAGTQR